jgi:hypothetical protein
MVARSVPRKRGPRGRKPRASALDPRLRGMSGGTDLISFQPTNGRSLTAPPYVNIACETFGQISSAPL